MRLIVESPAPNLEKSLSYYKKIGFQSSAWKNGGLCQSKSVTIFLNPDPYSRPCLNLFGAPEEAIEVSPSGTWIKLEQENIDIPLVNKESLLGNYGGVCIETLNLKTSFIYWQAKGFMGQLEQNVNWCSLKNKNGDLISLLKAKSCPHLFTNPSLAFFNGSNNKTIIQQIKSLQFPITQEVFFGEETTADNLILNDPGGVGFFIFND